MGSRKVRKQGSELKRWLLRSQIDETTGEKISVREVLRVYGNIEGFGTKSSNWAYHCKAVKEDEPYKGEVVTEELVYRYGVDKGWINSDFEEFSKQHNKKTNKLDDKTLMRMNEDSVLGFTQSEVFTLGERKETLVTIIGSERYEKINENNKKKLLKKVK